MCQNTVIVILAYLPYMWHKSSSLLYEPSYFRFFAFVHHLTSNTYVIRYEFLITSYGNLTV